MKRSVDREHDTNFGHITPLCDRLFGSWYTGSEVNSEIGVDDNYLNQRGLLHDLYESTRRSLLTVTASLRGMRA